MNDNTAIIIKLIVTVKMIDFMEVPYPRFFAN